MKDQELEKSATDYSTQVVTNMKIAQLLSEAYKKGFRDAKKAKFAEVFTDVESIAKAFNKHKGSFVPHKTEAFFGRPEHISVMNQGVFLRQILEELGLSQYEALELINKV